MKLWAEHGEGSDLAVVSVGCHRQRRIGTAGRSGVAAEEVDVCHGVEAFVEKAHTPFLRHERGSQVVLDFIPVVNLERGREDVRAFAVVAGTAPVMSGFNFEDISFAARTLDEALDGVRRERKSEWPGVLSLFPMVGLTGKNLGEIEVVAFGVVPLKIAVGTTENLTENRRVATSGEVNVNQTAREVLLYYENDTARDCVACSENRVLRLI